MEVQWVRICVHLRYIFMLKFYQHRYISYCLSCLSKYSSSFLRKQYCSLQYYKTLKAIYVMTSSHSAKSELHESSSLGKAEGEVEYAEELCPE